MLKTKIKYQMFVITIIVIMCSAIGFSYVISMNEVGNIYSESAKQDLINIKKIFLKDTVDNLIRRIEKMKNDETAFYQRILDEAVSYIDTIGDQEDFIELTKKYFESETMVSLFDVLIFNTNEQQIVYANNETIKLTAENYEAFIQEASLEYSVYHQTIRGDTRIFFGVQSDQIDAVIKKRFTDEIHGSTFSEDTYIWVNEVIDYYGGDNYAIRRIHPNLIDTEGDFLSTNSSDLNGNYPYLDELEGVKAGGEIYYSYFFKKINSDVVSEKLTYAKLYKDFDWIVAMGIHLDDVQAYIALTQAQSKKIMRSLILNIIGLVVVLVIVSIGFLVMADKWFSRKSRRKLEDEINIDSLTRAGSRRAGVQDLAKAFRDYDDLRHKVKQNHPKSDKHHEKEALPVAETYHLSNQCPAIISFDVDDFKKINDQYGHDVGDEVLKSIVATIKKSVRASDKIYRWGGEEFILVCSGVKKEMAVAYCNKHLNAVSKIDFRYEDEIYHVTISMGVSFFEENDSSYEDVIKRADMAMYLSKENGKNQVNVWNQ